MPLPNILFPLDVISVKLTPLLNLTFFVNEKSIGFDVGSILIISAP